MSQWPVNLYSVVSQMNGIDRWWTGFLRRLRVGLADRYSDDDRIRRRRWQKKRVDSILWSEVLIFERREVRVHVDRNKDFAQRPRLVRLLAWWLGKGPSRCLSGWSSLSRLGSGRSLFGLDRLGSDWSLMSQNWVQRRENARRLRWSARVHDPNLFHLTCFRFSFDAVLDLWLVSLVSFGELWRTSTSITTSVFPTNGAAYENHASDAHQEADRNHHVIDNGF